MAKAKFKEPLAGFSGKVGELVYAQQKDGSVVVRAAPRPSSKRKPGQLQQQDRIKKAGAYWRTVLDDPVKLAVYQALPHLPGLGLRHFGVRDYFNAPVIGEIDVSGYSGRAGEAIRVTVTDDTAVAEAKVQIVDMTDVVVEEGCAQREAGSNIWIYRCGKSLTSGQTVSIRVTAKDHPGNTAVKSCFAYSK